MQVQTVTGPVDTTALGFTYMHEHIVMNSPGLAANFPHLWNRDDVLQRATDALREAKSLGVETIVDMTPADYHREPELVRDASAAAGVHVIHATGAYWLTTPYFSFAADAGAAAALFIEDIEHGMNGTDIRAGILKCATDAEGVTRVNEKLLRAVARAHRATGVPIGTHTSMANQTGLAQHRIFREEGVDLGRVVIGHSNDVVDVPYLEQLIEGGSYIGMDRFGIDAMLGEEERIDLLVEMCSRGYADRIVLSQDAPVEINWVRGGFSDQEYWNWRTIPTRILPAARDRGVTDEQIRLMTIENPRRIFETQGAY